MRKCGFVISVFLFAWNIAVGQAQDSTGYYIERLNWESFKVITQYSSQKTSFDENAKKLIGINDNKKFKKLMHYLDQKDKAIAIHAILTEIYEPKKLLVSARYNYKKNANGQDIPSEITGITFLCNNLTWSIEFNDDKQSSYSLATSEMQKIKLYWLTIYRQTRHTSGSQ